VSHPLIIRPAAEDDLAEARDWYDAQQDGLGIEFLAAIEDVFDRIQATPELYARDTRASAGPLRSDFRTSSTTVCSLSQSKFWPCCTVVGARAFGEGERSRSRTRARVTKGRSQSCSTRQLRILFVDFRIAAVLLGPQYGFPRSRVGLAWEPLFIEARES
jgi:plasmid stabilization system protein ParE